MPRLFAAIQLGESAQRAIAAEQERLAAALRGAVLRWVRPEHLHVTLVFLGEVAEHRVAGIVQAMTVNLATARFQMDLGGFGVFPAHGAPRALWIGIQRSLDKVVELRREVASRLLGAVGDHGQFSPHLTLARWKDSRRSVRPRDLDATGEVVVTQDVNEVTLFHSRLSSSGPTYSVLARSSLSGTLH